MYTIVYAIILTSLLSIFYIFSWELYKEDAIYINVIYTNSVEVASKRACFVYTDILYLWQRFYMLSLGII